MPTVQPAPTALAAGCRVYAIGDIHGCAARLRSLHRAIAQDVAARPIPRTVLVHLGDYVDRGLDSAGVLDLLADGSLPGVSRVVNLMGNHEELLLTALASESPDSVGVWLDNGGTATLASWGIPAGTPPQAWLGLVPPSHLAFLQGLTLSYRLDGYLFVHAGVRPGVTLGQQSREDLLWIRQPFLSWPDRLGAIVVHGHTPEDGPIVRLNRIGIDGGAVFGGRLTCAVLERNEVRFLFA